MTTKSTTDYVESTDPAGGKTKAQILTDVFSLATQFSTCVEAFNLIHPSKDHDHAQKVVLAKLGLQQGRLLIFGDAVGISAPPANIARHMIPSHPGITNPDPHVPIHFGVRDPRLDEEVINAKVRKALHEIAGRPNTMSRDELMNLYGLKSPKSFSRPEYPALDTNRLEGFREKFTLLKDLVTQTGARSNLKRNPSMTTSHWIVKDTKRFSEYVKVVRTEVDALIDLMGVKEQVDRGIRTDLKSMGWHPDLTGPAVRQDWEKLRLIREACVVDYPEYIEVIDKAMQYISEEVKESNLARNRALLGLPETDLDAAGARRKSDYDIRSVPAAPPSQVAGAKPSKAEAKSHIQLAAERALKPNGGKEKRPGWLSAFKLKSWSKSSKTTSTHDKQRSNSVPHTPTIETHQRSLCADDEAATQNPEDSNALKAVRSKSLSDMPSDNSNNNNNTLQPTPSNLDSRIHSEKPSLEQQQHHKSETTTTTTTTTPTPSPPPPIQENNDDSIDSSETDQKNALVQVATAKSETETENENGNENGNETNATTKCELQSVQTANSYIDRHDMYPAVGRIETKDIRTHAHTPGL